MLLEPVLVGRHYIGERVRGVKTLIIERSSAGAAVARASQRARSRFAELHFLVGEISAFQVFFSFDLVLRVFFPFDLVIQGV